METVAARVRETGLPELPPLQTAVSFRPALSHLHRQRRETAALRDLFHSLAHNKKHRKHQEPNPDSTPKPTPATKSAKKSAAEKNVCDSENISPKPAQPFPVIQHETESQTKTDSTQSGKAANHFLPIIFSASKHGARGLSRSCETISAGLKKSHVTHASSLALRHGGVKSPMPYHTARPITRRPEDVVVPQFQALTQLTLSSLPHAQHEPESRALSALPSPSKRDLQDWQNEVVKVVPARPGFVQCISDRMGSLVPRSSTYPYRVSTLHPASHFYRSWAKVKDKDYVISPEWPSERSLFRSVTTSVTTSVTKTVSFE